MAALTFKKPRLMRWNGNPMTDHNRSPLSISVERIEQKQRMVSGTMRKYVVADKRTFSCSWEMVPKVSADTVDGFNGGGGLESFYTATPGAFVLELTDADGTVYTYSVVFSDFSKEIVKRSTNGKDFWNVNVTMEEV